MSLAARVLARARSTLRPTLAVMDLRLDKAFCRAAVLVAPSAPATPSFSKQGRQFAAQRASLGQTMLIDGFVSDPQIVSFVRKVRSQAPGYLLRAPCRPIAISVACHPGGFSKTTQTGNGNAVWEHDEPANHLPPLRLTVALKSSLSCLGGELIARMPLGRSSRDTPSHRCEWLRCRRTHGRSSRRIDRAVAPISCN